ncbi:F0F1 ATP synthase subunit A [Mesoaciditoga sp.]
MKVSFSKGEKIFLTLFLIVYAGVAIWNFGKISFPEGIGKVWQVHVPLPSLLGTLNPITVIMTVVIMSILIYMAVSFKRHLSKIPSKKQAAIEIILSFVYDLVEDVIPVKEFVKPTFYVSMTLFLFIWFSNLLGGIPGISVGVSSHHLVLNLFTDTWPSPTGDLNTNVTYAVMVLFISHIFAIKLKGFKNWMKGFIDPNPIMLPMNIIGELAKPVSHSLRLFGNIAGGGIMVLMLSYLAKYTIVPMVLWGFFGFFVGTIQAFVFSMLAIAYISVQLEQ